jgi:hypothetical protein
MKTQSGFQVIAPAIIVILIISSLVSVDLPLASASRSGEFQILIISAPRRAEPGEKLNFVWEVEGFGRISHTAVHWDTKPGNPADYKSYAKATPDFAAINPPHDAPHGYSVTVEAPQGDVMYYVIHAVIDGKDLYVARGERVIPLNVAGVVPIKESPSQVKETAAPAAGIDNTILLGGGAAIVVVAVAAVALARRRKAV